MNEDYKVRVAASKANTSVMGFMSEKIKPDRSLLKEMANFRERYSATESSVSPNRFSANETDPDIRN